MGKDAAVILRDVTEGGRMTGQDAVTLLSATGRDVLRIAEAADEVRERAVGDTVTFVRNQNLNVTNICVNACGFCGFSKRPDDPLAFELSLAMVEQKAHEAKEMHQITEICSVSGLHPGYDANRYAGIIEAIRRGAPGVHIHAGNPMEVAYAAEKSGISTKEVLVRLREAGLATLCGTAAEVLVDSVRDQICPGKIPTEEWVRIVSECHRMGIPTTATIMYGHIESDADRACHLSIIRDIQDDTGGFSEFVPLSFIHQQTPLYRRGVARAGATGREDILMHAVSRLFLDNIKNIQVSWVKLGQKMAQLLLLSGANDLGGTVYEESISKSAGAVETDFLDPRVMQRIAEDIGRPLAERSTLYHLL
ncbi:MAG: 7,8-didemethyl-8-hydroxy-5-deazariboflavin synthase subunit CofH [Methanocalculus sp. MSAO_Arc1]|uniref:5-amino-6-(D-ribitylamino)uracil--L-tyrosine 4-hydroxyphenyl transferase CofH n=1 Tax=Methanocalculus TaxID=71151 RepID=UPI000FF75C3E|nr:MULTISPECIES: 5-amino-6-(D-ribitylamino)uracil--L-tyrosine 4-hydroxyphenyl transferase CofH [unclassified Methanocalculus]MCP1661549.1 FO synthase subunit 2 [Methanocalculus sp. AMF5]RQD80903.1 MAG: 7,8-didemethyl-8-hydroxy-5-deazariboflavin synthase subunit CofH [Methanocalculus sp. MSAO_Arc1]